MNSADDFDITPDILLRAYMCGIFPMAETADDPDLFWLDPEMRGILPLEDFHCPRSLKKVLRSKRFSVTADTAFTAVLEGCAEQTKDRPQTWINSNIANLYNQLFDMGHAHSVEVWNAGQLVGGLYGVHIGSAFFGESMFHRQTNASKVALVHLVGSLIQSGITLLDTQFVTEHLTQFGALEIPKDDYMSTLQTAIHIQSKFQFEDAAPKVLDSILQFTTQTS